MALTNTQKAKKQQLQDAINAAPVNSQKRADAQRAYADFFKNIGDTANASKYEKYAKTTEDSLKKAGNASKESELKAAADAAKSGTDLQKKIDAYQALADFYKSVGRSTPAATYAKYVSSAKQQLAKATATGSGQGSSTTSKQSSTRAVLPAAQNREKEKQLKDAADAAKAGTDWQKKIDAYQALVDFYTSVGRGTAASTYTKYIATAKRELAKNTTGQGTGQTQDTGQGQDAGADTPAESSGTSGGETTPIKLPNNFEEIVKQQQALVEQVSALVQQREEELAGLDTTVTVPSVLSLPDSLSVLRGLFASYGLGDLADVIVKYQTDPKFLTSGNIDENVVMEDLKQQPQYQERFAAKLQRDAQIQQARANGEYTTLTPISEADQLKLEQQYTDLARQAGLPVGFYDNPQDFKALIAGDVSPDEYSTRISMAQQAALQSNAALREQLKQQYGIDEGSLTAFFLDANRAQAVTADATNKMVRQFNQAALQSVGVEGSVAEQVAAQSAPTAVNASYAQAEASRILSFAQQTVGGENPELTQQQAANVLVSGAQGKGASPDFMAAKALEEEQKRRAARYQGGGQIAATAQGVIGLTQANS